MRRFIALALAVICGVFAPPWEMVMPAIEPAYAHQAAYQHDHFIVPGERIGPIRVGMSSASALVILRSLGLGAVRQMNPYSWCAGGWGGVCFGERWRFGDDPSDQATRTPGRVLWVGTGTWRQGQFKWQTREGLSAYETLTKFYKRYGSPQWADYVFDEWWYAGLITASDFVTGWVTAVIVTAPQLDRVAPYPVSEP